MNELDKRIFKKNDQELQEYLQFKRRGTVVQAKKGKGSYSRNKSISQGRDELCLGHTGNNQYGKTITME